MRRPRGHGGRFLTLEERAAAAAEEALNPEPVLDLAELLHDPKVEESNELQFT